MNNNLHRPTERVLKILQLLSGTPDGLTLTEIASAIEAPKSSIVPVIHSMDQLKFISKKKGSGKYTIGISSFLVGNAYTATNAALQYIRNEMQDIVSKVNEICHLGVLENNEVLYIAKVDSDDPIRVISHIGKRLPVHCTALGKALVSRWTTKRIEKIFAGSLTPVTSKTIVSLDVLIKEIEKVKERGFATDNEEVTDHLHCMAVPLVSRGQIIAAISITMPSFRFTPEKEAIVKTTLQEAKQKVENYLTTIGFRGTSLINEGDNE